MGFMVALVLWGAFSLLVGWYWSGKGRSGILGVLLSLIFSPLIGLFIGICVPTDWRVIRDRIAAEDDLRRRYPSHTQPARSRPHGEVGGARLVLGVVVALFAALVGVWLTLGAHASLWALIPLPTS